MPEAYLNRSFKQQTLTIASGQTTSDAFDARQYSLFHLEIPASFTGATISFTTASTSGGTYQPLRDAAGAAIAITVTDGENLDGPTALASAPFFKIVSASAEGATRSIVVTAKG